MSEYLRTWHKVTLPDGAAGTRIFPDSETCGRITIIVRNCAEIRRIIRRAALRLHLFASTVNAEIGAEKGAPWALAFSVQGKRDGLSELVSLLRSVDCPSGKRDGKPISALLEWNDSEASIARSGTGAGEAKAKQAPSKDKRRASPEEWTARDNAALESDKRIPTTVETLPLPPEQLPRLEDTTEQQLRDYANSRAEELRLAILDYVNG